MIDVGHGTGESLILQLSDPTVPRPSKLTGITSLKAHYERSLARTSRLQSSQSEVDLYHGDVIYRPTAEATIGATSQTKTDVKHPMDPSSNMPPYDTILALDCAYHFNTRPVFLQQSLERLVPQGRIALADICFTPSSLQSTFLRALAGLIMPTENVISTDQYVQQMQVMGYQDVQLEDITEDVFPGFIKFLKSRGRGWWLFANLVDWFTRQGARYVIVSASKSPVSG